MSLQQLNDKEFSQFQSMIRDIAGISMSPAKKPLVSGRLAKRVAHFGLSSYGDYFRLLMKEDGHGERQMAVDLLTTNETYFFREPKHFDFMRDKVLPARKPGKPFRLWSAASSSGEEPYSLAMLMADVLGESPWEMIASDLSTRVLEKARTGLYPMERAEDIPDRYLKRFCLKGVGTHAGKFLIAKELRSRISFHQVNLNETLPKLGELDVIFLRNVMIYFDMETKRRVIARMVPLLAPGGYLIVGHSESLNGVTEELKVVAPSIYRRP
jgi:chemotaxis protein methyltransferase CheR